MKEVGLSIHFHFVTHIQGKSTPCIMRTIGKVEGGLDDLRGELKVSLIISAYNYSCCLCQMRYVPKS